MTITTDFTGTENYAERMAGLEAIHDWWFGAGSFAAAATLGQVRANLNTILVGTTILNRETFATWLSKVNTLNEPTEYAAALTFGESQSGALWQCTVPANLRAATDGTGESAIGGTIARINDSSGNALHLTQASTSLRPIRGRRPKTGRRNLLTVSEGTITAYPTRANVTDAAVPIPGFANGVQFGDNSVSRYAYLGSAVAGVQHTLSVYVEMDDGLPPAIVGESTSSGDFSLVIGAARVTSEAAIEHISGGTYRVSGTLSPTSGGGSGVVKYATQSPRGFRMSGLQLELGAEVTAYQKASSAYDISETGVDPVSYAAFDLVDDAMASGAIAGGLAGQAFVAGDGGCYVSDLSIAAGGAFSLGGTSRAWTAAAPGILRAVTGNTGRVLDALIRAGTYTEDEIARLERYYRALGGKGLLVPGPELVTNGTFAADLTGWLHAAPSRGAAAWESGTLKLDNSGTPESGNYAQQTLTTVAGAYYRLDAAVTACANVIPRVFLGALAGSSALGVVSLTAGATGSLSLVFQATAAVAYLGVQVATGTGAGAYANFDNISVRRLIPREDL